MSELIISRQQRVSLLTLSHLAARGVLNNTLLTQLVSELEVAATDTNISVRVVTGNTRFFVVGVNPNEMAERGLAAILNGTCPQLRARLQTFNKPFVAIVNGYTLGASCELALLRGVVVTEEDAHSGLPKATLSITLGAGRM